MRTIETDVFVVGTGPCGITAALALAGLGVETIAISRYSGPAHTPRAHITNSRTIEAFRDLGVQDEVQAVGYPLSYLRHNSMGTTWDGTELVRFKCYGTRADRISDYAAASPCPPYNIQQNVMEPVLLDIARQRGADVRFSTELVSLEQDDEFVRGHVRERDTGEEYVIQAKYAFGADGARSVVAEQLGIEFEGESGLQDFVNLWVEADLTKYAEWRPGVLYSMIPPGEFQLGGWACCVPWTDWLFVTSAPPDTPDDVLLETARVTIGDPDVEIKLKNRASWQINHLFATGYQQGRIFIGGDAAHRHPPAGGLGTNTSVQDAYNLAWKLALVVSGKAGPALLESYNDERQPVGQFVVERAMKSLHHAIAVHQALGLAPGQPAEEAWASINNLSSDEPGAAERREALAAAVKLQDYRSNAIGVDMNQRYHSGAIVDDGTPWPVETRDPELFYEATTHPGAAIPHAWIQHDHQMISSHDVVGHGVFTVVTGIGGEPWQQAAATVGEELGIEVPVRMIGRHCEYDDVYGEWADVREIADHGALLVRPDHHVAWRSHELVDSPEDALRAALRHILAR